jgi:hypothetical protein
VEQYQEATDTTSSKYRVYVRIVALRILQSTME